MYILLDIGRDTFHGTFGYRKKYTLGNRDISPGTIGKYDIFIFFAYW